MHQLNLQVIEFTIVASATTLLINNINSCFDMNCRQGLRDVMYIYNYIYIYISGKILFSKKKKKKITKKYIYIYRSSHYVWRQCITKQELILLISNFITKATIVTPDSSNSNWLNLKVLFIYYNEESDIDTNQWFHYRHLLC